jgi:hypothetical protein
MEGRIELADLRLMAEAAGLDAAPGHDARSPFH